MFVKHEPQPIAAETELLSTGDALMLHEFSSEALGRREVSSYLTAISNPAKFVLDLVDRQLRTAYRRQKLGLQDSVVKNLVLFFEELARIRGSENPQMQLKAEELASIWKENITIEAPSSSHEALAFLLFIMAFGLKSLINEEETALLVSSVFHYTQGPKLFHFFGLKRKIPGQVLEPFCYRDLIEDLLRSYHSFHLLAEFVRDLIKNHQYIPAVRIICLLKLKDFSATTLLMKEITVLRHSAMGKVRAG